MPSAGERRMQRKSSSPCKACKTSYLNCDSSRPSCSNCARASIECHRGYRVRFRHSMNPSLNQKNSQGTPSGAATFASDQPWPRTMLPLCFVDETEHGDWIKAETEIAQDPAESHSDSNKSPKACSLSPATSSPTAPRLTMQQVHSNYIPASLEFLGGSPDSSSISHFTDLIMQNEKEDSVAPIGRPTVPTFQPTIRDSGLQTHSPHMRLFTSSPLWPQESYKAAFLLRYYVENIAPMFDICDNARHFARIVPQRAAHCPALFNAILCVSSRRLNKIGEYDSHVAEHYHQKCLEHLIPALSEPCAVLDENLLAAIIILRYVEEIGMTASDQITESHLLGARAFLASQSNMDLNGLGLASFWVAMRQEIYMGFVHNRTVDTSFFVGNLSPLLEPTDNDCNYANQIIFHCLTCLRYCYGDEDRSISKWENLNDCLESLWSDKPQCFEPLWSNWANGAFFPELWYLNDAVTTGTQHYHLARVLLSAHSPKIPKLGPRQTITLRALEEDIKTTVRAVCGVAISNPRMPPNFVNASIAINMAGDRFTDRAEQEQLHAFLLKTDTELGWPTAMARARLQEAWGWIESPANTT